MRYLLLVKIFVDRGIGRRAQRMKYREHLLLFHQPAHLLYRLGWAVAVVQADQGDFAPVDAALGVELGEVGELCTACCSDAGQRTAVGHGLPDLNLRVAHPRTVPLFGERWTG